MSALSAILLHLALPVGTPPVSPAIKVDHFGYRPVAPKVAVFSADPGASVQIRIAAGVTVLTVPGTADRSPTGQDGPPSGDEVWWVDCSLLSTAGEYYVYSPQSH